MENVKTIKTKSGKEYVVKEEHPDYYMVYTGDYDEQGCPYQIAISKSK